MNNNGFVKAATISAMTLLCTFCAQAVRLQNDSGLFSAANLVTTPAAATQVVSSGDYNATQTCDKLFDGAYQSVAGCWYGTYAVSNMWCVYTFDEATVVDACKIVNGWDVTGNASQPERAPKNFKIRGSNNFDGTNYDTATWVDLDEENETGWAKSEIRRYRFANTTAYKSYALHINTLNGKTDYTQIEELMLYKIPDGHDPVTVTVLQKVGSGEAEEIDSVTAFPYAYTTFSAPEEPQGYEWHKWSGASTAHSTTTTIYPTADATLTAEYFDPATATPIIRYVKTNGSDSKDGASWENAYKTVAKAYNAVGNNPGGGEVWIAKGRYNQGAISMLQRVVLRGGFAGTETSADEADPEANPVIFNNDTAKTWPGTDSLPFWIGEDNNTFQYVPDDKVRPGNHFNVGYWGQNYPFTNIDGLKVHKAEFHGITFFMMQTYAIRSNVENPEPFIIKDCRFLCCNWYMHSTANVIDLRGTPANIENCEFYAAQGTVWLGTSSADSPLRESTVRNCVFRYNQPNWNNNTASGGIVLYNNAKATISGCTFERCITQNKGSFERSGAIIIRNKEPTLIEDCVFLRCGAIEDSSTGAIQGATVEVALLETTDVTFNRCRFEECINRTSHPGSHAAQSAAVGGYGANRMWFNNCSFIGNEYKPWSTGGNGGSSCFAQCNLTGSSGAFVNCLFEDNKACGSSSSFNQMYTLQKTWGAGFNYSIVNCVFKNNDCGYTNGTEFVRTPELRTPSADNENQYVAFINTVFENDAEDYKVVGADFASTTSTHYKWASCTCSTDWEFPPVYAFAANNSNRFKVFRWEPLDSNADVHLLPLQTKGTAVARGIAYDSPYRKSGIPTYRASNGYIYIYDTVSNPEKPWRLAHTPATMYTEAEANERGLYCGMESISDAFGKTRSKKHVAIGNLDYEQNPTLMLLR